MGSQRDAGASLAKGTSRIDGATDMKYRVVWGVSLDDVEEEVNTLISRGWLPIGGISVSESFNGMNRSFSYGQAMITTNQKEE